MHGTPHIVGDVMTRAAFSAHRTTPFRDIVRIMRNGKVSALPVLGAGRRVTGIVSATDLLSKQEFREGHPTTASGAGSPLPPRPTRRLPGT
ncbi:hypothetical protein SMD44_08140 [Streptomyces alboflavus]|uniref:CBS domain-containing protein n=1 Tax=Streptomyces alboflavus TaxID=67267 RepID=A0A1Z1WQD7_9ACTN|nr:hypothetical protein SMD44_08140 [Streptomyces alboflavus]